MGCLLALQETVCQVTNKIVQNVARACIVWICCVQVELLLRRAVNDRQQKIYTLACVENLEYNVAEKAEQSFDTLCRGTDRGTMKLI